jgi:uncharacterized membrane protein
MNHITRRSLFALLFSSSLALGLLTVRLLIAGRAQHLYLAGNLVLAWIPLIAAMALESFVRRPSVPRWKLWSAIGVWFLFFPNAPYIFTDLVHLGPRHQGAYWIDMLLILLFALTGLVLAFTSLRSMQRLVAQRYSVILSWVFVAAMSLLCGIGIYAGRFLRWNSWDVIARPHLIAGDTIQLLLNPLAYPLAIAFPLVFAVFMFAAYLTIWSLA